MKTENRYAVDTVHQLKYGIYEHLQAIVAPLDYIKILEDHDTYYVICKLFSELQPAVRIEVPSSTLEFAIEGKDS